MLTIDHKTTRTAKTYRMGEHDLVFIGAHSYANKGLNVDWWGGDAALRIGNYCSIAEGALFFLSNGHRTDWIASYPFAGGDDFWLAGRKIDDGMVIKNGGVTVGNDVWIGNGARILSGVTIGDGAVVGTGSVVTRDAPPFAFVAGNPARIVRYRFTPEEIAALQRLAWWNWSEEQIRRHLPTLCASDIAALTRAAAADPELAPLVGPAAITAL